MQPLFAPARPPAGYPATGAGVLAYFGDVLQQPGRVAAGWWAQSRPRYRQPVVVLLLLVGLTTLVLALLQAYHPAWAIIRQTTPLSPAQLAGLKGQRGYWGVFSNLRQLVLLPAYALPTWLVYRRQGLRYPAALMVHVLWNTAFNCYTLILFGFMAGRVLSICVRGSALGLVLLVVYHVAIGRTALDLRGYMAVVKALLVLGVVAGELRLLALFGL